MFTCFVIKINTKIDPAPCQHMSDLDSDIIFVCYCTTPSPQRLTYTQRKSTEYLNANISRITNQFRLHMLIFNVKNVGLITFNVIKTKLLI